MNFLTFVFVSVPFTANGKTDTIRAINPKEKLQMYCDREMQGIWDAWRAHERRTGRPFRFYRAYPLIGRGSVEHDPYTHEECETMFHKALRIPLIKRFQFWLDGVLARHG